MARKNSMGFFAAVSKAAEENGIKDFFVMTDTTYKVNNHGVPAIREAKKAVEKSINKK